MNGQINWAELFFSSNGRLARTPFVIAALALIVVAALYDAVIPGPLHWLTGWFVYPALLWSGACLLAKRLHDRGRSGWITFPIIISLIAVWPYPDALFDFLFMLVVLWAIIELGVMGGELGANRYGPSPLRPLST